MRAASDVKRECMVRRYRNHGGIAHARLCKLFKHQGIRPGIMIKGQKVRHPCAGVGQFHAGRQPQ